MVSAVTAEECDGHVLARRAGLVVDNRDGRRGLAPGSLDVERGDFGEAGEVLEAGAADDRDADLVLMLSVPKMMRMVNVWECTLVFAWKSSHSC